MQFTIVFILLFYIVLGFGTYPAFRDGSETVRIVWTALFPIHWAIARKGPYLRWQLWEAIKATLTPIIEMLATFWNLLWNPLIFLLILWWLYSRYGLWPF